MTLLLDENLSRRMVPALQQRFPESTQVALVGLERTADASLWDYARQHGFVLVSKDDDFRDLQMLRGYPPKLIVLRVGNAGNADVLEALLGAADQIVATLQRDDVGIVEVS